MGNEMCSLYSWNKNPKCAPTETIKIFWQDECKSTLKKILNTYIAYGMGRSYGDCCLPQQGVSLQTSHLNRFLSFDEKCGILRVESGITIKAILYFLIDKNWMLPVVPGTQYVTVGGAIANDVHGKNHHTQGTFGCSVLKIGLLRTNEEVIECTYDLYADFFKATIGGLGLTGLIVWAEIQLKKIISPYLLVEKKPFYSLNDYFELTKDAKKKHAYVAAWFDCQAQKNGEIRGILHSANWSKFLIPKKIMQKKPIIFPCYLPQKILNSSTIKLFNQFYFNKQKRKHSAEIMFYGDYLFPLDGILEWNKLYGEKGFYQYQCVIPNDNAITGMKCLLDEISTSRQGSFLSVLKSFGDINSPGMMSFPMPGCTLALDFPNRGEKTLLLLEKLDAILLQYGGRLYPAKDARMSAVTFKTMYPQWVYFEKYIDPHCHSLFWNRVML